MGVAHVQALRMTYHAVNNISDCIVEAYDIYKTYH